MRFWPSAGLIWCKMPDVLSEAERAAIAAFRGRVVVCPPMTFSADEVRQLTRAEWLEKTKRATWTRAGRKPDPQIKARRERIRELAPKMGRQQIANTLGIPVNIVNKDLASLGISAFRPPNKNSSGKVSGVTFYRKTGRWRARLTINGKQVSLGHHATQEEAISAVRKFRGQQ